MPIITVLMPVKNSEKFIREAINSVLQQTLKDFELLVLDNGSTDKTIPIIESYTDSRIHVVKQKNDFVKVLNKGLLLAKGEFIAQMDADDIMHSERLRIQHKRINTNLNIAVCASWTKPFKDDGSLLSPIRVGNGYIEYPILQMLKGNIIIHSSAMIRKSFLNKNMLKYENYPHVEDYKLWFEIAKVGGKIFIEPQYLLNLRVSDTQITNAKKDSMIQQTIAIKREILTYLLKNIDNKNLTKLFKTMETLKKEKTITQNDIFQFFEEILNKKYPQFT